MGKFHDLFKRYDVNKTGAGVRFSLPFSRVMGDKLDMAQIAVDTQAWQDVQRYMPIDTGLLISDTNALNVAGSGVVYLYPPNSEYGHYQHEGVVYVDPLYGIGGFYDPTYGFWSRPDVAKIPSERKLQYTNPEAQDHWGDVAIDNHMKEWLEVVKRALK